MGGPQVRRVGGRAGGRAGVLRVGCLSGRSVRKGSCVLGETQFLVGGIWAWDSEGRGSLFP